MDSQQIKTLDFYSCGFLTHGLAEVEGMAKRIGAKDCTPEIETSEVIVDFRGIFQWMFSGMVEWILMCSTIYVHVCEFWCAIVCPERKVCRLSRLLRRVPRHASDDKVLTGRGGSCYAAACLCSSPLLTMLDIQQVLMARFSDSEESFRSGWNALRGALEGGGP